MSVGPTVPTGSEKGESCLDRNFRQNYLKDGRGDACMGHSIVALLFFFDSDVLSLSPEIKLGVTVPTGSERGKMVMVGVNFRVPLQTGTFNEHSRQDNIGHFL